MWCGCWVEGVESGGFIHCASLSQGRGRPAARANAFFNKAWQSLARVHLAGPFDHHLCGRVTLILRELKRAGVTINIERGFRRRVPLALRRFNLLTEGQFLGRHVHITCQHALLGTDIVCPACRALNEEEVPLMIKANLPAQKRQGLLGRLAFEGDSVHAVIVAAHGKKAERNSSPDFHPMHGPAPPPFANRCHDTTGKP